MERDLPTLHAEALHRTRALVAGIGDGQWTAPTPCTEWDVRALVNHIVAENLWVAPLVAGETIEEIGDRYEGDVLGDDPLGAYDTSAEQAGQAFGQAGAMEAPCAVSYGPVPGSVFAGHRLIDLVVHGWDVAEATGQETRLDPIAVDACLEIVEPQAELLTASGYFGTPVEVGDDAGPQTRLLALLGRRG